MKKSLRRGAFADVLKPGTGKSFIGAQSARCIYLHSKCRVLLLSYTNHALDQFLEDLLKVGIPREAIVRLGSKVKCTQETLPLLLSAQKSDYRRSRDAWNIINMLKSEARDSAQGLADAFQEYQALSASWEGISEHLEFSFDDRHFYEALHVPTDRSGWDRVGKGGKKIGADYLYQRWSRGDDAGIFKAAVTTGAGVWNMPKSVRQGHIDRWLRSMLEENLERIERLVCRFNGIQGNIDTQFGENNVQVLRQKRFIACTTTGAATHSKLIRAADPDVVLVEEAGEILESHILAAMAPSVRQLILIGDHKQLRPKVNNHALSVEKGDG